MNNKQTGGVRVIPEFKDATMTPFRTNQEKTIKAREKIAKANMLENITDLKRQTGQIPHQDPLLELKINQPQQQQQMQQQPQQMYPATYVPIANPFSNSLNPWQYTPNTVPVIKKYNISLGNGNGDITKIANLYEDILPNEENVINNTFNTLKERMILHNYIRSIFIKTGDGEELLINGGPNNSKSEITNLLSHVKLLEINPYHFNRITNNPYKTLPNNFVMYRSCYPIRLSQSNIVECSKSSVGMNVRIYLLSKYDENINTVNGISRIGSDIWRELDYYQYIREEIIKPNLSPNFITLHSYYMTKNTGINFKKFEDLKSNIDLNNKNIEAMNSKIRNDIYLKYIIQNTINDPNFKVTFRDLVINKVVPDGPDRAVSDQERAQCITNMVNNMEPSKLNQYLDSDKCLVMLSEAPTQHLLNWATKTYQQGMNNAPVSKMIQHGYHDDKVWGSIYFQLLLSMLIMLEKEVMFTEFSIENNVYIKDLNHSEQNVGIWKYIYNGLDYYVPNYGYLLLIDSNYCDIKKEQDTYNVNKLTFTTINNTPQIVHKIKSTIMNDTNSNGEIYKLCLEQMIKAFSRNNLGQSFVNYGGIAPTNAFLNELDNISMRIVKIKDDHFKPGIVFDKNKFLSDIKQLPSNIIKTKYFNMLHSRIGTPVKDNEKTYIGDYFDSSTKVGSIIVIKQSSVLNTFGIYMGDNKVLTTNSIIFSQDDRNQISFDIKDIDMNNILNYYGQPEHIYEPGKQYNVLETYLISAS